MSIPKVAITMGDGAGVGPEVIVRALSLPQVREFCVPIVIGDVRRLRQAAEICGVTDEIRVITDPSEAATDGTIAVIDLDLLPDDLPWGELSAVAGDAAYQYVAYACNLALSGAVDAICTAPLNKEAMHAGGHNYPGHTELLAALCGVEEVSMMLSTGRMNVIHVTTHIGLIDAIESIDDGLVERTIERGWAAMRASGIVDPIVAVCGINPHAGENGLFGRGEEGTKIEPAVRRLVERGRNVLGPLSADTVFFRAGRGDFDLVVAMYHDQGHGPVKVLGLEAGVNITVGLPVIRTSVDHGTAFDIAGTGEADPRSMVEAIRQASAFASASELV
jgi:4-hydroxythreonine-4-phosphate dehydrogenase